MLKWQYWHKCLALHCNWVFHLWSFITSFKNNLLPHGVGGRGQAEINISIQWEILVIQSFSFCVEENRSAYKKALTFFFFFPRMKEFGKKKKKTASILLNSFSIEMIYSAFLPEEVALHFVEPNWQVMLILLPVPTVSLPDCLTSQPLSCL